MARRPGCFCWAQTCGVLLVQAAFFVRSASAGGPTAARCANTGSHKTFSSLPSESEEGGTKVLVETWLEFFLDIPLDFCFSRVKKRTIEGI